MTSHRERLLHEAASLTGGDRNKAYGPPHKNLTDMAGMVAAYLKMRHGVDLPLTSEDMAWIMVMAKISRTAFALKDDNYVDAAAYAAIAGECRSIIVGNNFVVNDNKNA